MKLLKRILCLLIVGVLLTSAIPLASAKKPDKPPGKPGDGEQPPADPAIAYIGQGNKNELRGLMVMNTDGSNQAIVWQSENHLPWGSNSWSADGKSIAFNVNPLGSSQFQLWCVDISVVDGVPQGSNVRMLVDNCRPAEVAWAPNSDEIAYVKCTGLDEPPYSIMLVPANGGTSEILYSTATDRISYPAWSSDGTKLAFIRNTYMSGKTPTIDILTVATGAIETVFESSWSNLPSGLDWARTKDVLAFHYINGVYTLDLSIVNPTHELIINDYIAGAPSWSPDDSQLAFGTYEIKGKRGGDSVIRVYDFGTGDISTIAKGLWPSWRPTDAAW